MLPLRPYEELAFAHTEKLIGVEGVGLTNELVVDVVTALCLAQCDDKRADVGRTHTARALQVHVGHSHSVPTGAVAEEENGTTLVWPG